MNRTFFTAVLAILFAVAVSAQQPFTGPINQTRPTEQVDHYETSRPVERYHSADPCPCPCPEPVAKKPENNKPAASTGVNIENNPTNCINIQLPNCPGHCQQALPVNHGNGWAWPANWNPNWSWLWPLLFLIMLGVIAYQLWRMANESNNTGTAKTNPVPPSPQPTLKMNVPVAPSTANTSLAQEALKVAAARGSSFKYFSDGGFRLDLFEPVANTNPTVVEDKKPQQ